MISHKPLNENHIFHEFSDIACSAKIRYLKSMKFVFMRTIYLKMYMVQKMHEEKCAPKVYRFWDDDDFR